MKKGVIIFLGVTCGILVGYYTLPTIEDVHEKYFSSEKVTTTIPLLSVNNTPVGGQFLFRGVVLPRATDTEAFYVLRQSSSGQSTVRLTFDTESNIFIKNRVRQGEDTITHWDYMRVSPDTIVSPVPAAIYYHYEESGTLKITHMFL